MLPKTNLLTYALFCIFLLSTLNYSCTKEPVMLQEVTGEYCTFRDGLNGPVTSQVSIVHDSTGNYDYIISNISGYTNSSQAFLEIGCDRVLDRLVITEYTVLIGDNEMKVVGDGDIMANGGIHFEITISQETDKVYELFLNSDAKANHGSFSDDVNSVSIAEEAITFSLNVEDVAYNFLINELDNSGCAINIPRQNSTNTENNELHQIESELFFTGNSILGEVRFSKDNWQNIETVDLDLQ